VEKVEKDGIIEEPIMSENGVKFARMGHTGFISFISKAELEHGDPEPGAEIAEICSAINGDESIYVVIIQAEGDFCGWGAESQKVAESEISSHSPAAAIWAINRPTIMALFGDAVGSGLEIALACDMRIGVETARFGLPQIKNGQIPTDGGTQRLSRLVGKGKAMEMILTGDLISASEALEIGLVNKIVKREELKAEIEVLATTLVTKAPLAMRYCKEAVNKGLDMTLEQGLRLEADLYFLLHTTSDRTEGVQSYLQKRKPQYEGK
jgi:enoyl-CoA hydratase/carnithine racemase